MANAHKGQLWFDQDKKKYVVVYNSKRFSFSVAEIGRAHV